MTPGTAGWIDVEAFADLDGLVAGITTRAFGAEAGGPRAAVRAGASDFGLSTGGSALAVTARYESLAARLGFAGVSVCRQVHGTEVIVAGRAPGEGVWIPGEADGFVGVAGGRLFAVTVADCVPVYVVEPATRALALLHAGWRGAAAGILGRAVKTLQGDYACPPDSLRVHLGPAICGSCYEVGPEVPRAFGRRVEGKSTIDVRDELAAEADRLGVRSGAITRSPLCTRCNADRLHSHRAGAETAGRMAACLGWEA